jgi:hypothetical protein
MIVAQLHLIFGTQWLNLTLCLITIFFCSASLMRSRRAECEVLSLKRKLNETFLLFLVAFISHTLHERLPFYLGALALLS